MGSLCHRVPLSMLRLCMCFRDRELYILGYLCAVWPSPLVRGSCHSAVLLVSPLVRGSPSDLLTSESPLVRSSPVMSHFRLPLFESLWNLPLYASCLICLMCFLLVSLALSAWFRSCFVCTHLLYVSICCFLNIWMVFMVTFAFSCVYVLMRNSCCFPIHLWIWSA